MFSRNSKRGLLLRAVATILMAAVDGCFSLDDESRSTLRAQQPAAAPVTSDPTLASKKPDIIKMIREGSAPTAEFEEYFNNYFFPQFQESSKINDLPKLRKELKNSYLMAATEPSAQGGCHARLNDMAFDRMKSFLNNRELGKYEKAIKYNAILVIGDLNEIDGSGGRAKPLRKSFDLLVKVFKLDESYGYLHPAVLVGITRHAVLGAPYVQDDAVIAQLLGVVKQTEPLAGRDKEAHDFIRAQAIDTLATIGNPGKDNSVVNALVDIMNDKKAWKYLRFDAATALAAFIKPGEQSTLDYSKLANNLGHFALELCQQEMREAPMSGNMPNHRYMLTVVDSVMTTLGKNPKPTNGIYAAAKGTTHEKTVHNIHSKLNELYTWLEDPYLPEDVLVNDFPAKADAVLVILTPLDTPGEEKPVAQDGRERQAVAPPR